MNIIPTPDMMWEAHRAALDGRSSVTGTPLPERLGDCPPLARGAHYAMALVAVLCVDGDPASVPVPPGITPEKAHFLRCKVLELLEPHRLRAAVNTLKRIVAADPEPSDCESDAAAIEAELARLQRENERLRRIVDWMVSHDHQHEPALVEWDVGESKRLLMAVCTHGVDEQAVGKAAVAELARIGFARSADEVKSAQAQLRAEMLAEMPVAELLQLIYAARRHVQQATKMPENVADAPSEAVAPCQDAALVVIRALSEKP